jgi:serine/threonine protein kinase
VPAAAAPAALDSEGERSLIGHIIAGRYELLSELGRGGMGLVFCARHIAINKTVAVKVLRNGLAQNAEAITRFHREARAAASIGNPHIVDVIDFGYTDDGDAYIAMELLEGTDLRRAVRVAGTLSIDRAVELSKQIAKALSAAHGRGIIHRDLKSENVFLVDRDGREHVKLLDFGISKVTELDDAQGPLTSDGVLMGTPHYMAPELLNGATVADARADLYALGCVLFEMVTGGLPFTGKTAMEVAFKHVHEQPAVPSQRNPLVPPMLDAVILRALEKAPNDRFATAEEFLEHLRKIEPGAATLVPVAQRPASKRRLVLPAVALTLLVGTVALALQTPSQSVLNPSNGLQIDRDSATSLAVSAEVFSPEARESNSDMRDDAGGLAITVDEQRDGAVMSVDGALGAESLTVRQRAERAAVLARTLGRDAQVGATAGQSDQLTQNSTQNNTTANSQTEIDSGHVRSPDDGLKQTPYGRLTQ